MKVIPFSSIIAVLVTVVCIVPSQGGIFDFGSDCTNNKTHNFYYGTKAYYDRLFYSLHVSKPYSLLRKTTYDLEYPPKGQPSQGLISYIEVLDQRHDGNGGCAYIMNGGVGTRNVTLHLKSKRNYGLDFMINIFGH